MLEITNLSGGYGPLAVLHGVNLVAEPGAITTIVGSNGAGKSTLLRLIAGLLVPQSGTIRFDSTEISSLSPANIVRHGVSLVPEGRELFPRMSVLDNLRTGAFLRWHPSGVRRSLDRIFGYFPVLDQKSRLEARNLSGGEQQMLAFGRALMAEPRCLLLDEPSIGLAPMIELQLMDTVRRIALEQNVAVVLVEQNAALALRMARKAYVLELGEVVLEGPGPSLLDHPRVKEAYLGA